MHKRKLTTLFLAALVACASIAAAEPFSDRITVTVRGKGPDVVLIPGLACSNAVWDATAAKFEGRYRLHIVQVAGFAGSPARSNAQGAVLQPTVDAIHTYITMNKLKAPKVIGHSLGGLMEMMLAIQHPEDASKLLVVDSLPFLGVLTGATNAAAAVSGATAIRDMILNQTQEEYAQGEAAFLPSLVKSPEGLKAATAWAVASDKSVVARAMYDGVTTDLRSKLPGIKIPVTVLYPWDSAGFMPQDGTDKLYRDSFAPLPNKTLVRIDNSLHFIMFDQPEAFAKQVDAFLK